MYAMCIITCKLTENRERVLQLYPVIVDIMNVRIRVITKLPNSEQSYKGKVKTHKYISRQNQSTTGKL
jgi:hypothetical protein